MFQSKLTTIFQEKKIKEGVYNEGEDKEDVLGLWGMSRDYYGQFLLQLGRNSDAFSQFQVRTC